MNLSAKVRIVAARSGLKNPEAQLKADLLAAKKFQATTISELVQEAFNTLLYEGAQRYGTYVSNWRVTVGGKSSQSQQSSNYGYLERSTDWYVAGSSAAVGAAKAANSGVWDEIANYALTSNAIYPQVTVFNNTEHAEQAEYGPLRPENESRGAAGAFERFEANLKRVFQTPISTHVATR